MYSRRYERDSSIENKFPALQPAITFTISQRFSRSRFHGSFRFRIDGQPFYFKEVSVKQIEIAQLILNVHVTSHNFIYFFFYFFIHTLYSMDSSRLDDEHKLIARYAQRLAQEARTMVRYLIYSKITNV